MDGWIDDEWIEEWMIEESLGSTTSAILEQWID